MQGFGVRILGPGITAFGAGPDGGREASFSGPQHFPNTAAPWDGYGIMQAKYKMRLCETRADTAWLHGQIESELDAWADPARRRVRDGRRPEYLIITTNVGLPGVPGSGGKDRIGELIRQYAADLGLRGWSIWDAPQIGTFLNAYPDVRRGFTALITPSDVLAEQVDLLRSAVQRRGADEAEAMIVGEPVALAQLPAVVPGFTGRDGEVAALARLIDPSASPAEPVIVSAVAGLAGVGKTTLAIGAAHAVRRQGWFQVACCSLTCMVMARCRSSPHRPWNACCVPSVWQPAASRQARMNAPRCTGLYWRRRSSRCWSSWTTRRLRRRCGP